MNFPARISLDTPQRFRDPLPDRVDVAIIGGGVIGVFAALYLAEAGKRVLICEKGRVAGEQSSRNWGWIRQQCRDESELPIAMQSVRLWQEVDARLGGRCGVKTRGVAYLTTRMSDMSRYEAWVRTARAHGLHSEMLSASQIAGNFSGEASYPWIGGVRTPSDCKGEPWQAVPEVAALAHSQGVSIAENCAVRCLDVEAGHITGITTESGRVKCNQVLLAGGAWSRLFLAAHGVGMPQLSVVATVARTGPLPDFALANTSDEELALRRRDDGGYTLALCDRHGFHLGPDSMKDIRAWLPEMRQQWRYTAVSPSAPSGYPDGWRTPRRWTADETTPFERMRILDPAPMKGAVERMAERFARRFPRLGRPKIVEAWSGMIDAMPDSVPIVDFVPGIPGLTLAAGMSGHGFGIGPGFGRAISRRLLGLPDEHDLSRFRFTRFADGSRLVRGPSL